MTQKMEKSLPEDCCGNFSLQPYHNRILIGDFIEHCPEPFPCTAVIYLSAGMYTNPHTSLYVSCQYLHEIFVVCNYCVSNHGVGISRDGLDTPISFDI